MVIAATSGGIGTQNARAKADHMGEYGSATSRLRVRVRKIRLRGRSEWPMVDPFHFRPGAGPKPNLSLIAEHQLPVIGPAVQHTVQPLQVSRPRGTNVPPHCSAASTAWACRRSCRIRSELVNSVWTGMIRAAPISAAFSTMKSVRAFLIGANSNHRSGGSCRGLVCSGAG